MEAKKDISSSVCAILNNWRGSSTNTIFSSLSCLACCCFVRFPFFTELLLPTVNFFVCAHLKIDINPPNLGLRLHLQAQRVLSPSSPPQSDGFLSLSLSCWIIFHFCTAQRTLCRSLVLLTTTTLFTKHELPPKWNVIKIVCLFLNSFSFSRFVHSNETIKSKEKKKKRDQERKHDNLENNYRGKNEPFGRLLVDSMAKW